MTIIENLDLKLHRCRTTGRGLTDLSGYLECVVHPRLASYVIFLNLIDSLSNEHSLRGDAVTIEILKDYRQLAELATKAEGYLT